MPLACRYQSLIMRQGLRLTFFPNLHRLALIASLEKLVQDHAQYLPPPVVVRLLEQKVTKQENELLNPFDNVTLALVAVLHPREVAA